MNSLCPVLLTALQSCIEASPEDETLREAISHLKQLSALCNHYHNNLLIDEIVQLLVKNTSIVISPRYFVCKLPLATETSNGLANLTLTLEHMGEEEENNLMAIAALTPSTSTLNGNNSSGGGNGNGSGGNGGSSGTENGNGNGHGHGSGKEVVDNNPILARQRLVLVDYSPLQQLLRFAQPYWDGVREDVRLGPMCHTALMEMIEEYGPAIQKGFNDILRLVVSEYMLGVMSESDVCT